MTNLVTTIHQQLLELGLCIETRMCTYACATNIFENMLEVHLQIYICALVSILWRIMMRTHLHICPILVILKIIQLKPSTLATRLWHSTSTSSEFSNLYPFYLCSLWRIIVPLVRALVRKERWMAWRREQACLLDSTHLYMTSFFALLRIQLCYFLWLTLLLVECT